MSIAAADSLQFAFTVMFHYLFPIGTMGVAPFVAWYTYRAWRTGDERDARSAAFWTRLFAVNFAAGVVTGIPLEFQFGTNWATFSNRAGAVVGEPLALEGVYAFFLESIFLGILLAARSRVSPRFATIAAVAVWLGSWLSGYFIVVADAWMQHPVGYSIGADGTIALTSLWAVLTSKFATFQYAHVLAGAVCAGGFIVAGVGAFYLLAAREVPYGREYLRAGVLVALVGTIAVVSFGDINADDVTESQPIKLAAMEGLFESSHGAPLAIIGMPDVQHRKLIDPVFVPELLSYLTYGNLRSNVRGLSSYATELWPPVELTYYSYHIMVGLGTILFALAAWAALLLNRKRLFRSRFTLWVLMLIVPFPYIANETGWVVTEVGRQPWIIYGVMRTANGISQNVSAGETIFTLIGFLGMYFLIGVLYVFLTLREVGLGPGHAAPETAKT